MLCAAGGGVWVRAGIDAVTLISLAVGGKGSAGEHAARTIKANAYHSGHRTVSLALTLPQGALNIGRGVDHTRTLIRQQTV